MGILSKIASAMRPRAACPGNGPEIVPVVMAGGSGSRLWPLSREALPKQFCRLVGERSLLQETLARLDAAGLGAANAFVSTGEAFEKECRAHCAPFGVRSAQYVVEPARRGTLAALALVCKYLKEVAGKPDSAVVFWAPSDHVISPAAEFGDYVRTAAREAAAGSLVCFGIRPSSPETAFGYVKAGPAEAGRPSRRAERFVEKPDAATAQRYILEGGYFWNGGMFLFALGDMLRWLGEIPEMPRLLALPYKDFAAAYAEVPQMAMEYAVVERHPDVRVVPLDLFWSDVGSWDAVYDDLPKDADGNLVRGETALSRVRGSLVWSLAGRTVAVEGMSDVVVVDSGDAVLVTRRGNGQGIRNLTAELKRRNAA